MLYSHASVTQLLNTLDLLAKCHQANGDFKSAAYTMSSFKFDDFKYDRRTASPSTTARHSRFRAHHFRFFRVLSCVRVFV